jgi:uncharacterized protein YkwD
MPRLSPSSRWVVVPTVLATAALVTAVAWAGATSGRDDSATPAPAPAAFEAAGRAGAPPATGADRAPAADRSHRAVLVPPAGRLRPLAVPSRPHLRPAPPAPTRSSMPPAPPVQSTPPPAPSSPATTAPGQGGVTAQVVTLTNAERAKAGCGPLTVNSTLTAVAQAHSQDMATNNYFDHNSQDGSSPFDRMTAAGYRFSTAAENIAAGQRTPQDVMTGWMNSPGHRANILNCALHEIGVGYATSSSSQYGVYWTQDFGTPR